MKYHKMRDEEYAMPLLFKHLICDLVSMLTVEVINI